MHKFGDRRTNWEKGSTFQGVETPSQSRFVGYYDVITNKLGGLLPSIKTLKLKKVIIYSIKGIGNSDGSDLSMMVYLNNKKEAASCDFATNKNCQVKKHFSLANLNCYYYLKYSLLVFLSIHTIRKITLLT